MSTRRDFLRDAASLAALGAMFPRELPPVLAGRPAAARARAGRDSDPAALAAIAIDAARSAGAAYGDARLTFQRMRVFQISGRSVGEVEDMAIGVRALVNGYWGFASSPLWTPDEAARIGRAAVALAKTNALGKSRVVEWLPAPRVNGGEWTTPVEIDPFEVAPAEVLDWFIGCERQAPGIDGQLGASNSVARFSKELRVFASSEGSTWRQTFYVTSAAVPLGYRSAGSTLDFGPAQGGWELVKRVPLEEEMRRILEALKEEDALPIKPVEVGRYPMVLGPTAMAQLLGATLGYATELDRALGYEANGGGTSFLNDPLAMLGTLQVAAPLLSVTANRSQPGALATVRWDDEAVEPEAFDLVKDGVLHDFQTTRESAAWIAPWYQKRGVPVRSHGCASAPSAGDLTMQHTPNLVMRPAKDDATMDDLVAGVADGIAMDDLNVQMDFQHASGAAASPRGMQLVKRGKRVARLDSREAGILFRSTDLWRNLVALGGAGSLRWVSEGESEKGEPSQTTRYSIGAVPAVFKDVSVVDFMRKA